ncbi:MAG: transporter [Syntrophales bacterium]|nr:transporter [Syntrophales bacterium]
MLQGSKFKRGLLFYGLFCTVLLFVMGLAANSYAAHPLITDDAGTQGKGKFQLEVNGEYNYEKETEGGVTKKETGGEAAAILSYGIVDSLDIVLGVPYQWFRVKEEGDVTSREDGISDMSLELKWRFYEKDGLSLALKPGMTLPTGDEEKELGTGRATYSLYFITTKEIEPWAFHLNLGYTRNEYKLQEDKDDNRKDIWHASLAGEVEVVKNLKVVANIGVERNADEASSTHPAFILGGLIYSLSENFDIDFGVKGGLNKPETDYSILAGIALRF